jgi:hypothetical protein
VSKSSTTTGKIPNPTPGEILLLEFKRSVTADTDLRLARYSESQRGSGLASRRTTTCCSGDKRLMLT